MDATNKQDVPKWAKAINSFYFYLGQEFLGGPQIIKMAWVINLHKFLIVFVVALLMIFFKNFSTVAWVYLALHGTYGFCWLLKHIAFRDARWESKLTFIGAVILFLMLATYWIAPYLLISDVLGVNRPVPSNLLIAFCISLFSLGLTMMIASDCQKHFTLKYRRGLITEGMFSYVRFPNYLGEMMIYASFALLVQHWIPWVVLVYWWTTVFFVNMLFVESSISRYPEWEAYKARTGRLIPWHLFTRKPSS